MLKKEEELRYERESQEASTLRLESDCSAVQELWEGKKSSSFFGEKKTGQPDNSARFVRFTGFRLVGAVQSRLFGIAVFW